jgi:hypothetical protein
VKPQATDAEDEGVSPSDATVRQPMEARPEAGEPLRFSPWLTCEHRATDMLSGHLIGYNAVHHLAHLKRRPKAEHQANFETIARAIVANLALASMSEHNPNGAVAVSLRAGHHPQTRYDRRGFTSLPVILARLEGAGMFTLTPATRRGTVSTITPTPAFAETLRRYKWRGGEFAVEPGGETILLSRTIRNERGFVETREMIDYGDNPTADRLREEMATINAALAKADLRFIPDGGPPVFTGSRTLVRHFKQPVGEDAPRFDLGGRMFSGWWLNLKSERRQSIRIGGEPVVELDYQSMALRLAYVLADAEAPSGDLYALPALGRLSDERWRPGVKVAVLSLLSRPSPLQRLPMGSRALLPKGTSATALRRALLDAHPALAGVFERGIALELQHLESRIMIAVLLRLIEERCVALPIHDGLLVQHSKARLAVAAMREVAAEITGHQLPVVQKQTVFA